MRTYFISFPDGGKLEIMSHPEVAEVLCERFLPQYMEHFDEAIARSLGRTMVIRITITEPPVGKAKP